MTLPSTRQLLHIVGQLTLGAAAVSVVATAYLYPETRMPIVIWLVTVAVVWRSSPEERG